LTTPPKDARGESLGETAIGGGTLTTPPRDALGEILGETTGETTGDIARILAGSESLRGRSGVPGREGCRCKPRIAALLAEARGFIPPGAFGFGLTFTAWTGGTGT
jgi:hypothetical protein